ncbi:cytochrome P450 [Lichenibacterium minor]|uniref:Cytochrome P450 n=1 Tax=Lichenibacterium minor TaxID=2316528 RepID=A0A4Q2U650_9HYPH|nr:cytochrome P450 [Lichenibacterium minor]RYC32083.1 cytochrome P450 [Lichenibacterium minor]
MTGGPAPEIPALATSRLSTLGVLARLLRDPLSALPPEVHTAPVVEARFAGGQRLYLLDPALIQDALVRHADDLTKTSDIRRVLGPALGDGLLTAEGAHWRWQRRGAAPAFAPGRLAGFLPAMIAAADATARRWAALGEGAVVDIGHETTVTTFDIIVSTMLSGGAGLDVARVERSVSDYLAPAGWMFAIGVLGLPAWTPHPGRRRALAAARWFRGAIRDAVARRRAEPGGGGDLVTMLLGGADPETGRAMTDGELADNIATFIAAGHETTANGLAWAFHLLSRHPDQEERLVAEVQRVTGGGPVRPEHVEGLVLTRATFEEAMRLYPPAPLIARRARRGFPLGPARVEEGGVLVVPIHALHRHRLLWDEPERFDPDRFLPDRARARHRYSFMPFGAGPRVCIGAGFATLEAVAILAVLLRAFRVEGTTAAEPRPSMRVTLRPAAPIRMRLRARDPGNRASPT